MNKLTVKVGFIGCGGIASAHMGSLQKIEDVQLVAFCDVVEERAQGAAQRFKGRAYTDYKKMLDSEDLDALYICLPPHIHGDQELSAIQKGLPLMIEKPIANNLETAKQINEAIEKSDLFASVAYHWRYYDTTDLAKELLKDKSIGMVLGYWMGGLPGVPWWRVMKQSGGQLVEQTTHIVDLARYLAGEVKKVYAAYALRALQDVPNLDVPDVGSVVLEFENGAVGNISNTCILSQGYMVSLHIICKDLVVEHQAGTLKVIEPGKVEQKAPKVNPFELEDKIFIEAVKTKDRSKIRSSYADALRSLAVTLSANESAKTGKPVELPM